MNTPTTPSRSYLEHVQRETQESMRSVRSPELAFAGAPEELVVVLEREIESLPDELGEIVHRLHARPETAFQEYEASRLLVDVLARHGIDAVLGVHGVPTAFRAEVSGASPGPTIAVLAEYDALPELGHACGHNVIAAAGVGAFLGLALLLRRRPDAVEGTVVLLGTPAEEGHTGKEVMARRGAFDGIDAAIMTHPYGYDLADQVWLGRRLLTVTFAGIAAHASAQPFMGRNALDAASLAYQGIGLLRQQLPPGDRIHAVLAEGGDRPSIIPERAVLKLYARSKHPETLKDLSARLEDVARGAALMTGTGVDIAWDEYPASLPVRTNTALTGRWVAAQRRRGRDPLPAGVVPETVAASTDFGNVSHRVPGMHPLLKIAAPETALHTREFAAAAASAEAARGALDGACGLALTALDYLCDARLRRAVAQEFESQGGAVDVPRFFD